MIFGNRGRIQRISSQSLACSDFVFLSGRNLLDPSGHSFFAGPCVYLEGIKFTFIFVFSESTECPARGPLWMSVFCIALSRHQVDRVFGNGTRLCSVGPLLLQSAVQIFCCGENFQGSGKCVVSLDACCVLNGTLESLLFYLWMRIKEGKGMMIFSPLMSEFDLSQLPYSSPPSTRSIHSLLPYSGYLLNTVFCPEMKAAR